MFGNPVFITLSDSSYTANVSNKAKIHGNELEYLINEKIEPNVKMDLKMTYRDGASGTDWGNKVSPCFFALYTGLYKAR